MWPFRSRPDPVPEQKALGDDTDVFDLLTGGSLSSFSVSASTAMQVPAVANAVKVISESCATQALTVKRKVGGEETDVPDHPALALLTGQANPWTSGYELIRDLVSEALTRDAGGMAWINRPRGRIAEIIGYEPGSIAVQYATNGTREPTYRLNGKRLARADVIHLHGPFDKCPLTLARNAIGAARAMEAHVGNFFSKAARPGGVIESPKPVGDEGIKRMIKAWRAAHDGPDAAGKTAILFDGAQFKPLAMSSVDAQLDEARNFQIAEIARAFGIPQHVLGKLDRATWGNYAQASKEYLTATVLPWLRALESAFNRTLLTDDERGEYRFAFDLDDFSQGSLVDRANVVATLITAQAINSNEARDWLGLPAREGGDEFRNPAINTTPANNSNQQEAA